MKGFLRSSALLVLYLVVTAKSCDNRENDATGYPAGLKSARDSILVIFGADKPSVSSLAVFTETAKMKLTDLLDYTAIITDTAMAPAFRQHAGKMLIELLISGNCRFRITGNEKSGGWDFAASDVAMGRTGFGELLDGFRTDSVVIEKILHPESDTLCSGRLSFTLGFPGTANTLPATIPKSGSVNFYAAKRKDNFGKDTLRVWKVFLGDLEIHVK
jgi:hypothetical protein